MTSKPTSSEPTLIEALETCLNALESGADLEATLALYPTLSAELRPLLVMAQSLHILVPPQLPMDAMKRSRTKLLGQAATYRTQNSTPFGFWRTIPRFALSSLFVLVLFFAGLFTANSVSASALPGDSLYGLKRSFETLWLGITPSSQAQVQLEEIYRERRIDEVRALLAQGRTEKITFQGVFSSKDELSGIAPERWFVSDIKVLRTLDTQIVGDVEIGMWIEVVGITRSDGYVEALEIRPQAFAFVGLIETMDGNVWKIDNRLVQIRPDTELASGLKVGIKVMVLAEFDSQANIFARAILYTSTPEPIPTSTTEPTLEATSTPTSTDTNTAEPTPTLTHTPQPTITNTPTATYSPTSPPAPPETLPPPTKTPKPTDDDPQGENNTPTQEPTDDDDDDHGDETKTPGPTETEEDDD